MTRRMFALPAAALSLVLAATTALAAAPFPQRIDLPDGWQPEGITSGPGFTAFAGSLADGRIARIDLRTGEVELLVGPQGAPAVGLDYEAGADRLWVAGGPTGEVRVYDASSGELLETYAVSPAGFLNDVVVTRDAVYVTDSFIQQVIVIPLDPGAGLPAPSEAFALPIFGDFVYIGGEFNANGIVEFSGFLIVPQSNTGDLFAIDPETGRSVQIVNGGFESADGLELVGSTLYSVRNFANQIDAWRINGGAVQCLDTISEAELGADLDIPTTITFAGGRLWTVNARFLTTPGPDVEYWITQVPLASYGNGQCA